MRKNLTDQPEISESEVLDHSRELVESVYRAAPVEYQRWAESASLQALLHQQNAFNYGKLFTYAEFVVFRREFCERFPEATPESCINAFCTLFLKNDISITNLLELMEGSEELEQLRRNP